MDQYYVLGNPIAHSKSPLIHARFAELTGQSLRYDRLLVPLESFASTLAQLLQDGVKGCNVTVPFKLDAFEAATTRSDRVQLAQAANTLLLQGGAVHADNTDGVGLVNDIQNNAGVSLAGRDVLLIGAGGAGAGALAPLLAAGPRRLVLVNRTRAKADALVGRHKAHASMQRLLQTTELLAEDLPSLKGAFDVVINASASSLAGAGVPVAASVLKPGALACDMMYGPAAAGFMAWAKDNGATPRDGLGMLVEQAAEAFELWRAVRPPSAQVLREMRA
jgi:shikimate dehydrogenase